MKKFSYIFDFDGTLADSMPVWSAKMINVLEKNHIKYPTDIIKIITPLGDIGAAKYFKETLGATVETEEMLKQMDEYALPKYQNKIVLKEGVFEYLSYLHESGFSINVLTASPHKMLDPCLKRNCVYDMFDNIWSCEDFKTTKSDPDIYRKAVKIIGSDTNTTAFFDDNICTVKTAKIAGLYTVGVYDESAESFSEEMQSCCDRYIKTFRDIKDIK